MEPAGAEGSAVGEADAEQAVRVSVRKKKVVMSSLFILSLSLIRHCEGSVCPPEAISTNLQEIASLVATRSQ
jgi:hypothetical protein